LRNTSNVILSSSLFSLVRLESFINSFPRKDYIDAEFDSDVDLPKCRIRDAMLSMISNGLGIIDLSVF